MSNYPEHEKVKAISAESQTIANFLEYLDSKKIVLCEHEDAGLGRWALIWNKS